MSVLRYANPFDQLTPVVRRLIIANVVVFFGQMLVPERYITIFGLLPIDVIAHGRVWQLFTYAFLHANGWHIFFNMFALWMFGPHVEGIWGGRRFFRYYVLCILGAAAAQFAIAPDALVIGASGAIYGVLLAFGFLLPDAVIYLFFFFPVRALQAVLFIALLTLVSAMSAGGSHIAHFAHLGGMLTGFLYFKVPEWGERFRMWRVERRFARPAGAPAKKPRMEPANDLSSEVDRILEKISAQGVDSLTRDEHETMQRYAKQKR